MSYCFTPNLERPCRLGRARFRLRGVVNLRSMSRHGRDCIFLGSRLHKSGSHGLFFLWRFLGFFGGLRYCRTVTFEYLLQGRPPYGFRQEEVHSRFHALLDIALFGEGGEGDYRRGITHFSNQTCALNAIEIGHLDVHKDQIKVSLLLHALFYNVEGFLAILGYCHVYQMLALSNIKGRP